MLSTRERKPRCSVVIGSNAPPESLEACLAALEGQRDASEVLVFEGSASPPALRERFPWARFVERPGLLVPELWRDGIESAEGEIVALTIAQMTPAEDWLAQVRAQLVRHDAIGGAIDPGKRLRPTDWAEYFCRYVRDMRPFSPRDTVDLPGDNAAYKRALLEAVREVGYDLAEGADMVMVKPALPYLDVVHAVKSAYPDVPLAAYNVSGEYAMLKAAAAQGWLDERRSVLEALTSIARAGADMTITYYAKDVARWLGDEAVSDQLSAVSR